MNKKRKTVIGLLILVLFLAIAGSAYNYLSERFHPDSSLTESKKIPAPDFAVLDNEGNEVNLADYFGKPIVLNFWASWCPPCRNEMPHFNKVYGELKEDVTFLMVDMVNGTGETTEKGKAYIAENEFTLPVFFDTKQDAAKAYGITAIPQTFFIDKDGNIVSSFEGSLTEKKLLKGIESIR